MPLSTLLRRYDSQLRQAARVLIGTAVTYALYRALGLPQGYWAVFTVIIVLQGSIASTLGAAIDRLAGTVAGGVIGGAATIAIEHGETSIGVALTLVVGVTAFAAAIRPQLKVAPVTAAILLLTQPAGAHIGTFVIDRILEITLGGVVGVAISVTVFPARSHPLVISRAAAALEHMGRLLAALSTSLEASGPPTIADEHAALRKALGAVEQAASDADRERASGLAYGRAAPVIARALWRVRNDLILVARAIDLPLPPDAAAAIAAPAAALLRAEADFAGRCATALRNGTAPKREAGADAFRTFEAAFAGLRQTGLIRALEFADAGRVFGLAFALEVLHRDLVDLSDRLGG